MGAHRKIDEAIIAVEVFLEQTADEETRILPWMLAQVSSAIEAARAERASGSVGHGVSPDLSVREEKYRSSLEQLRTRLSDIEWRLLKERDRVADDRARISQTMAWNSSLSKTH